MKKVLKVFGIIFLTALLMALVYLKIYTEFRYLKLRLIATGVSFLIIICGVTYVYITEKIKKR